MTFPMNTSQDCLRAWEAMPWVLQNSATHEQSELLKSHLARCESCRAEFAQQTRLRQAVSLPSDIPVDANAGLNRLLNRLDAPQLKETLPLASHSGHWLMRAMVAAVLIQAIGLGVLGARLWSTGSSPAPAYRTLSQESAPVAPGAIRVVPDANMTLTDWNALLHSLQLQVVGGPNDVGAYMVAPKSSSAMTQHTLQQLRATRGIQLAEPVATTP
jgi:hypothetical protein